MLTTSTPPALVSLDFWADLACPWCYVGSRRLALAVAHEADGSVLTRWRSFQLQPGATSDSAPLDRASVAAVLAAGREVGIVFRRDALDRQPDTALAQRAVLLYDGEPRQRAVSAALHAAHFERGLDLAGLDTVVASTAHASGETQDRVRQRLQSGEGETQLAADLLEARLIGVTATPTYVVPGRVAVQGAQEVDVLRDLIAEGRRCAG